MRSGFVVRTRVIHGLLASGLGLGLMVTAPIDGAVTPGWRQAAPGYSFSFPRDHASHPDYRLEWWYYTGNLSTAEGHRFGYQLTFFRVGVNYRPDNPSRWAVRDLFMTHLAISDLNGSRHYFAERFNRAGPGWARAAADTYHVWNQGWEVRLDSRGSHCLRAADEAIGLDLTLDPGKAPVLHGEGGYSRKGSDPGNASNYYSLTRMPTRGTIRVNGESARVEGLSWMDHEFGTTFLDKQQTGWDWFSIQLEDGRDIMLFELRRSDGSADPHSGGTLLDARGGCAPIGAASFKMGPSRPWRSAATGASYPLEWRIDIGHKLELTVRSALEDQELRPELSGIAYYEGAVNVEGTDGGKPVRGRGYLEMTGYAGSPMGTLLQ